MPFNGPTRARPNRLLPLFLTLWEQPLPLIVGAMIFRVTFDDWSVGDNEARTISNLQLKALLICMKFIQSWLSINLQQTLPGSFS